jgi:myosin heavy subunit
MAYFKLEFVERSKIGTLFDTNSSLKAPINYYSPVFSINSLERALLRTFLDSSNMSDTLHAAAEAKNMHQNLAKQAFERWKDIPMSERRSYGTISDFVSQLECRAIPPLIQMVEIELTASKHHWETLNVLKNKLYYAEQTFRLERIEELDHDVRDARKRLDRALDEKVKLEERVKIMEGQQRNLHREYDAIFDSDHQKEKELKKAEKKRKKLAKKLEDAQERLNKDECTRECVMCMDAKIKMAFTPCGHLCTCKKCCYEVLVHTPCPICRNPVNGCLEIFMS